MKKINVRMLLAATLSGAALAIGSILPAVAANDHSLPSPEVFLDVNPCTGTIVTLTQVYTKSVLHESVDASGGSHFTGTQGGTITASDGFAGRFTVWFGFNEGGGASGVEVGTFTYSATLRNGTGQVANVHFVGHYIVKDGTIIKTVENESLVCVGKPSP